MLIKIEHFPYDKITITGARIVIRGFYTTYVIIAGESRLKFDNCWKLDS